MHIFTLCTVQTVEPRLTIRMTCQGYAKLDGTKVVFVPSAEAAPVSLAVVRKMAARGPIHATKTKMATANLSHHMMKSTAPLDSTRVVSAHRDRSESSLSRLRVRILKLFLHFQFMLLLF
jgi:hypothetical protein